MLAKAPPKPLCRTPPRGARSVRLRCSCLCLPRRFGLSAGVFAHLVPIKLCGKLGQIVATVPNLKRICWAQKGLFSFANRDYRQSSKSVQNRRILASKIGEIGKALRPAFSGAIKAGSVVQIWYKDSTPIVHGGRFTLTQVGIGWLPLSGGALSGNSACQAHYSGGGAVQVEAACDRADDLTGYDDR